ncbi:hypothetical protein ACQ7CU_04695 [Chryseobacterium arthrosphaerae]|uniref:hypothetical protein n=1 Tax=Chryseobacterium arthrosphaerae TaxID=651561 RepID=UPI003D33A975
MKKIILLTVTFLLLYSCKKQVQITSKKNSVAKIIKPDAANHPFSKTPTSTFKCNKPSDLIPEGYKIQYEAEGDLNLDGLSDIALVIRKKEDTLAARKVMIVLKNTDKTYILDKISDTVFPDQYDEFGREKFYREDISIEKGELNIKLLPNFGNYGTEFSSFKYLNGNLALSYIETYNVGAGSEYSIYYEPLIGRLTFEMVDNMKEKTQSKTFYLKKEIHLFEKTCPEEILYEKSKILI